MLKRFAGSPAFRQFLGDLKPRFGSSSETLQTLMTYGPDILGGAMMAMNAPRDAEWYERGMAGAEGWLMGALPSTGMRALGNVAARRSLRNTGISPDSQQGLDRIREYQGAGEMLGGAASIFIPGLYSQKLWENAARQQETGAPVEQPVRRPEDDYELLAMAGAASLYPFAYRSSSFSQNPFALV